MKILSSIATFLVGAAALASCNGPEKMTIDPGKISPAVITSFPTESIVLDKTKPDATQVTLKWTPAAFGYQSSITYFVVASVDGASAEVASTIKSEIALVNKQLNTALVKQIGLTPGAPCEVDITILSSIGAAKYDTVAKAVKLNITPYSMDPIPYWVIGEYCGWDHGKATKIYSADGNGIYTGWLRLYDAKSTDGKTPIKFTSAPDWAHDEYGGTLEALALKGPNIMVDNDFFTLITVNIPDLKASIDKQATRVGMVGDATPNGWDSPDTELAYDATTNTFRATGVEMKAGGFKFRCNDDWSVCDWGATETPGRINTAGGGENINFTGTPGKYTVVFNIFSDYPSYELIAE